MERGGGEEDREGAGARQEVREGEGKRDEGNLCKGENRLKVQSGESSLLFGAGARRKLGSVWPESVCRDQVG